MDYYNSSSTDYYSSPPPPPTGGLHSVIRTAHEDFKRVERQRAQHISEDDITAAWSVLVANGEHSVTKVGRGAAGLVASHVARTRTAPLTDPSPAHGSAPPSHP
jgi:hypothetical protein